MNCGIFTNVNRDTFKSCIMEHGHGNNRTLPKKLGKKKNNNIDNLRTVKYVFKNINVTAFYFVLTTYMFIYQTALFQIRCKPDSLTKLLL